MKKVKNWQINVSLVLMFLSLLMSAYDLLIEFLIQEDFFIFLGYLIGMLLGLYFVSYIPIKIMIQYRKEVKK